MGCNIVDCGSGLRSLGIAGCPALFGRAYKFVFTQYFKADGTVNELSLATSPTLNSAYFAALLIQADKPWLPSPEILNYESEREADKFETFNNDTISLFVQQGKRTVKGVIAQVPANLSVALKQWNKTQVGVFIITDKGELVGMEGSGWMKLAPIKIELGSFGSVLGVQTNTALNVQKAMIQFNYDVSECDANLKMIAASSFDAGYDIKQFNGLVQVDFKAHLVATATTVKVAADTNQGSVYSPILVEGLVVGDFVLTNLTTGLAVVLSGVTEIAGKYVGTHAAQTTGDDMKLTCTKAGYQFAPYLYNAI